MVDAPSKTNAGGRVTAAAEETRVEAHGASQIGPFDYCPKLGFREYWYPAVWAKDIGWRRPISEKMLGEDLVFFRGRDGKVVALDEWCPHRGARLSRGWCEFRGTVTCPYHGYTYNESGQCVAGLTESENSTLAPKLRARKYPTEERDGIVYVWMGITEPVPLEEDLPFELIDPAYTGRKYTRVKLWETNWTEPVLQGVDFHWAYLHRGFAWWKLLDRSLMFFRKNIVYTSKIKVTEEGENYFGADAGELYFGQGNYAGLGKWPRHTWWRVLPSPKKNYMDKTSWEGTPWPYKHGVGLPSYIRTVVAPGVHLRWQVPVTEDTTRVWTFSVQPKTKTWPGALFQWMWYYFWRKPAWIITTNEKEDLTVFKRERLNLDRPHKLGPLDVGVIYFRRHLPKRSRDFQRLGGAYGCYKQPPDPDRVAEWVPRRGSKD